MGATDTRVDWVDTAKGICIIFVVMMHSTLSVERVMEAQGWMGYVVAFARPFRMPDFFLISGLFLGLVIDRPWRRYIDRKVVHFFYFYALWLTIELAIKAPGMMRAGGTLDPVREYLFAFIEPFGPRWFIYILPIFFVVTRMVKGVPIWFVLLAATILESLPVHTGWTLIDEFCARYVFFFAGYALAKYVFASAAWARANRSSAASALVVWAVMEAWLVFTPVPANLAQQLSSSMTENGLAGLPVVSVILGGAGAMAIIFAATLLTGYRATRWLTWLGAHSIVVYLAFIMPMAVAREILIRTGIVSDVGTISVLSTMAGVAGPVILYGLVQMTGYGRFLFERPEWAYLDRIPPKQAPLPAE